MTGAQCKKIIKSMGFTQSYVARSIGLDPNSLGRYLNGKAELNRSKYYRLLMLLEIDW
ncbi:helix-turn-helix domain-containing protein [Peribacillus sp. NPDC097198]|uniref:helix-turn-helix domain-containing protein n=1 Tax=Peribacillus sp. NPDC097198 TaxID=3364397 RepID=UPI0038287686